MNLDVAVVGAGVAGTRVAHAIQRERPDWSIALFERTERIGGRLRSLQVAGVDHPIELGGMRFLTSHRRVADLVETLGIPTHAFDRTGSAHERSYLRGIVGRGADDHGAERAYALAPEQRGRSAAELAMLAFERIVPGFQQFDHDAYARWRATGELLDRPVTTWAIGEALERLLGDEGRRFVTDSFGYDSGMRAFCAPDLVEFLFDGGDPAAQARTPDDGMERIPQEIAAGFRTMGGHVLFGYTLASLDLGVQAVRLQFTNGEAISTRRVVLATPQPALRLLASASEVLRAPPLHEVIESVEGFPAMKLYLWYERPWWRPAVAAIRTTTDLPIRKTFYFEGEPGSHSVLLAMYTDGLDVRAWLDMYDGGSPGSPAPSAMLAEVERQLRESHPEVDEIPAPLDSSLTYWGSDPHEVGWHFWRAGVNSDRILERAPQPDPDLPIYLANEAFSRRQSWVEGALEAADATVERLLA
jgi:monoamine oxidase